MTGVLTGGDAVQALSNIKHNIMFANMDNGHIVRAAMTAFMDIFWSKLLFRVPFLKQPILGSSLFRINPFRIKRLNE